VDAAALEAVLVRELLAAWHTENAVRFRGALRAPALALDDATGRLGAWHAATRSITLARALVLHHPWGTTLEVLKHEMAHQFVHEILGVRDETAHGPAFTSTCARFGIDATARGLPEGDADPARARTVRRIQKLLALAESPHRHEAEAAMAAAHRLLLQHNLDAFPGAAAYDFRQLGRPAARVPTSDRLLASLLATHFFVDTIWARAVDPATGASGHVLEVCGTPANLDMAAYVHAFVRDTAWRLWKAHRATAGVRGERERARFVAGVVRGFHERLDASVAAARGEGLVWVGDPGVAAFLRRRHPRMRTVRVGVPASDTYEHGRAAGRDIVLHRPVATTETPARAPRLLPGAGG
jgi:hypothetical protein